MSIDLIQNGLSFLSEKKFRRYIAIYILTFLKYNKGLTLIKNGLLKEHGSTNKKIIALWHKNILNYFINS